MAEPWPDAGVDLDLFDPALDYSDHERIREYLKQLPDISSRLRWLERFFIEFQRQHPDWRNYQIARNTNRRAYFAWELRKICEQERDYWQKIADLEAKSQTVEVAEPEDSPGSEGFTTARGVMLLYYLMLAANDGQAINKSALGRLLTFFTGQKPDTTKSYWQNPIGKRGKDGSVTEATKENRAIVRGILEDLGLSRAIDLLDKDAK
jgi:hypothetical protein